ncbi:hypothetical protein [Dongshaea marina]|uniref:hypothetical protein n=1 Tax=Dongshaea marina TaxID=2047966 RepID=UPI000D3E30CD|nr:hypothetical protein [Dongshaea marina]
MNSALVATSVTSLTSAGISDVKGRGPSGATVSGATQGRSEHTGINLKPKITTRVSSGLGLARLSGAISDQQLASQSLRDSARVMRSMMRQIGGASPDLETLSDLQQQLKVSRNQPGSSGQSVLDSKFSLNLPGAGMTQEYDFQIAGLSAKPVTQSCRHLFTVKAEQTRQQMITVTGGSGAVDVARQLNQQLSSFGVKARLERGDITFRTSGCQLDEMQQSLNILGQSELYSESTVRFKEPGTPSLEHLSRDQLGDQALCLAALHLAGRTLAQSQLKLRQLGASLAHELQEALPGKSLPNSVVEQLGQSIGERACGALLSQSNFSRSQLMALLRR